MIKLYLTTMLYFLLASCNQDSSKAEKQYISNLEEKNRILEKELQEVKNKPPIIIEKTTESIDASKETPINNSISKDYFTIGSTEQEVLNIQGEPSSINDLSGTKFFSYGLSSVTFKNGVVTSYFNNGNLKIKVAKMTTSNNTSTEENKVKYIYYTIMTAKLNIELDPITKELKSKANDYSPIYTLEGYTVKKKNDLEFCLTTAYKQWTGDQGVFLEHVYDDKQAALFDWNNEEGSLFNKAMCF